ncbi:DNA repair protein RecN [Paenibacillus beijingensis]|uniref:DNA repair protein RecN n=1 Tax=Paenibacillus beijingensis TaxID=1126833 RepID=A0A0D5NPR3_9BACL|nr:DNA repair protein RecN [Paenibacillus beijingensis]AJY77246.1 DNA recombination protein RecN [Paenibacillus beijingensis]
MLRELSIRNLAVIEEVAVEFHNGFHVLTGETGAGKSILIDALSLLVGGRGSSDMVRYGCDKAEMEAMFELPSDHPAWKVMDKLGLKASPEDLLIIKRELSITGKSACRINGSIVNMTMLREVGECLVNVHGQHEHQSLLKSEHHLEWLDLFAGAELADLKAEYQSVFGDYQQVKAALRQVEESTRQNMQLLDLYRFQIEEIEAANLKPDEEEWLAEEKSKLSHTEKIMHSVSGAYSLLFGAEGLDAFSKALAKLEDIRAYDGAALNPIVEQLQSAFYQAEDAVFQLRDYKDSVQSDPERLAEISDRLDLIHTLKRKYGESIPDILAYAAKITTERDLIENRDEHLQKLTEKAEKLHAKAVKLGKRLSDKRRDAGDRLSASIEAELKQLGMSRTIFQVQLEQLHSGEQLRLGVNGLDEAAFMLAPNPGEPLKPLSKIASGGEMSRIMLALKSIFAKIDQVPVLVFDEVDTGVSGRAAQAIAEKMSRLSSQCQVFSITHLPQVACMADYHYEISKNIERERTSTSVKELTDKERIEELARMLGGVEVTEKTRHHAQEMLHLADQQKGA